MSLLSTTPSFGEICNKVLGHFTSGDSLFDDCFPGAISYNFDSVYVGSKDRLSNFAMYGPPTASATPGSDTWLYNETDTRTFTVTCNHSQWKFCTTSTVTGWTVEVWDAGNTSKIGNYSTSTLWDSGVTVRVHPTANNSGGTDKYCSLNIAAYENHAISGAVFAGTQSHLVVQPTFSFEGSGLTLVTATVDSYSIGSAGIVISWKPSAMATTPHTNYINITKPGPTNIYNGSRANCHNGVLVNSFSITLSENVTEGQSYTIYISYDLS